MDEFIKFVTIPFAESVIKERKPRGMFITVENQKYIVIDNRTGDAHTNQCDTMQQAYDLANNIISKERKENEK